MSKSFFDNTASDEQLLTQRRDLLKLGFAGVIGAMVPFVGARDVLAANDQSTWRATFRNAHTEESFSGVYRVGDKYLPDLLVFPFCF